MTLHSTTRAAAITSLKRIRSKAIDTERLLLLDQLDAHGALERASQIEGQAHVLAIAITQDHEQGALHA